MNNSESYLNETEVIVHAGGLSERWFPVTQGKIVKPATDVGKNPRPMIDWVILPYVLAGKKKFFISLWHKPESVISHLKVIEKNTDIKFEFLLEPSNLRLGRAGVIKYYMEKGILNENKPKLSINGTDMLKLNVKNLIDFHLSGLKDNFFATTIGTKTEVSPFSRIIADTQDQSVKFFEAKPLTKLPPGEYAHTGIFLLDSAVNKLIKEISQDDFPVDLEKSKILPNLCEMMRIFEIGLADWIWFKDSQDYKKFNGIDFEKFYGINSVEKFLGPYSAESL